jgi:hypothetical protein
MTMPDPATPEARRQTGLIDRFTVARTDGKSAPGEKHDGCVYFVLDLSHDPHAKAAVAAYAESCEVDYPALSRDLHLAVAAMPLPTRPSTQPSATPEALVQTLGRWLTHDSDCGRDNSKGWPPIYHGKCTCGLQEALAALQVTPPQPVEGKPGVYVAGKSTSIFAKEP